MSIRRNTLWNLAGSGLPLLVGAVTIPYLIKQVGVEAFGVLTLVWALIGYFSLFDFGLGRALTQQVATCRVSAQTERLPSLVKTGLIFTAVTGLIGGLLLAALASPLGFSWLRVSVPLQQGTLYSLLIAAFGIPMSTLTTGLRGVLEAYEDFKDVNVLRMLLGVASFGFPALSVMNFGPSLTLMVASLIVARLAVMIAHLYLVYQKLPTGWITGKFSRHNLKNLLSFGAWMTISNVISPLMVVADRFVISAVLGASLVAYYTVPFEVIIRILIIPGALTAVLFPRLASLKASDPKTAKALYDKCLKYVIYMMTPICIAIAFGTHWGLSTWLGAEFAKQSWIIALVLLFGILFNSVAQVPFSAIQAYGDARLTARLHIVEVSIYIPILIVSLMYFGLVGAAIAWSVRTTADCVVLTLFSKKIFI